MNLQLPRHLSVWTLVSRLTGRCQLHSSYDRDTDFLFARFGAPAEADTVVVDGDVAVRLSRETGQPIGIEVVDCAAKFRKHPSTITPAFARELLARYGQQARAILNERSARPVTELEPAPHTR